MNVNMDSHIQRIYRMTSFFLIFLPVIFLASCDQNGNANMIEKVGDDAENSESSTINVRPEDVMDQVTLSQDIESLVAAENLKLSISQHEGIFIPTSTSFSQRIISFLGSHGDAVARVESTEMFDLVLRFDGYEDILVNLDTNTFWFAGADHVYPFQYSISDQWERYIIRVIDGELKYDSFEQTILQKTTFVDHEGSENTVSLFFDGDIGLRIDHAETVIAPYISEKTLNYNQTEYPSTSYSLRILGDAPLIAVVNEFPTAHGSNVKLDVLSYDDNNIKGLFSTSDLTFEINDIDYETGEVSLNLPFANTVITYVLTNEEKARTDEKLLELEINNVEVNTDYITSTQDGITYRPYKLEFVDIDDDSYDDQVLHRNSD